MELKKEFGRLPKDMVYDMYLSLVYDCKDYDSITRSKMLDSIIKEYSQKHYLYHICTGKELDFLKKFNNKQLTSNDIKKYDWEIKQLNQKCIFSRVTFEIFEEQKKNVELALENYENNSKEKEDEVILFMISVIKINAEMLSKAFISMISSVFDVDKSKVENLFGHPLFNFYCAFHKEWFEFSNDYEELIYYREYWDKLEDIRELRKEYGMAGCIESDIRDNYDIFYYGFPIRKEKVKKMYDKVKKHLNSEWLFYIIDDARVLNDRCGLTLFIEDEPLLTLINEALDEMPCSVMNGFTPNQYNKEKIKAIEIKDKLTVIPQNNAHLSKNAADEFYKLYFALLEYVNDKYNITDIKKIYKQHALDVNKLYEIDEYLWKNKNIIDKFIKENKYNFTEEELDRVKLFKKSITSDHFVIIGFEREYTKVLSEDGKIYMIKGIRADIDKIMDPNEIPKVIGTTLIMFKDNIIFNGFFSSVDIVFGNDMKESILKEIDSSMVYYHL